MHKTPSQIARWLRALQNARKLGLLRSVRIEPGPGACEAAQSQRGIDIWATPFHICRLLDAQGLFANATISQRAVPCCSDFAPIKNRRVTKRAELVDVALTFGRLSFLS
jgi:hypothetical protein